MLYVWSPCSSLSLVICWQMFHYHFFDNNCHIYTPAQSLGWADFRKGSLSSEISQVSCFIHKRIPDERNLIIDNLAFGSSNQGPGSLKVHWADIKAGIKDLECEKITRQWPHSPWKWHPSFSKHTSLTPTTIIMTLAYLQSPNCSPIPISQASQLSDQGTTDCPQQIPLGKSFR